MVEKKRSNPASLQEIFTVNQNTYKVLKTLQESIKKGRHYIKYRPSRQILDLHFKISNNFKMPHSRMRTVFGNH